MIRKSLYLLLFLLIMSQVVQAEEGKSGQVFPFLRYGIGTRAQGLGKAYTALSDDAIGLFWNPAGMARPKVQNWQITFGYDQLFFDGSNLSYLAGFYPNRKWGSFGLVVISFSTGDFIGRDPYDLPTGDFSLNQTLIGFSYARNWGNFSFVKNLSTGFLVKSLKNKIASENNSGLDADLGFKWKFAFLKKADWAISYKNLLKSKIGEDENIPALVMGASYIPLRNLIVTGDYFAPSDGETELRLGFEYTWNIISNRLPIFIRAGYCKDEIAFGTAINFGLPKSYSSQIDFAYTNQSAIELSSSKFSMTLFGRTEACDTRLYFMLGAMTSIHAMHYQKLILDKFDKRIDDLNDITSSCSESEYGPLAEIILGNVSFYRSEYSEAINHFTTGYTELKNQTGGYTVFTGSTPTSKDVNYIVRYETHCNFAESFLLTKKYVEGIFALDELRKIETFISPDNPEKPTTGPKYRFLYDLSLLKIGAEKYQDALVDLNMITSFPVDQMNPSIYYLSVLQKGKCYYYLKDYENALRVFQEIPVSTSDFNGMLNDFPNINPFDSPDLMLNDDKLYFIALTNEAQGNHPQALSAMYQIVYYYPYSNYFVDAINFIKK